MLQTQAVLTEHTDEALKSWLQRRLSEERYQHSLGAQKKAIELAQHFQFLPDDTRRAAMAGLLHDCAKLLSPEELLEQCRSKNITVSDDERNAPQTLHPFVGAEMVRLELNIGDSDLLNAIRYHTTGRAGMSDVEKVVYIADKIEENTRNPLYTQKINAHITGRDQKTLDSVVLYLLNSTIQFLIEKGQIIHPRTLDARNDVLNVLKTQRTQP